MFYEIFIKDRFENSSESETTDIIEDKKGFFIRIQGYSFIHSFLSTYYTEVFAAITIILNIVFIYRKSNI